MMVYICGNDCTDVNCPLWETLEGDDERGTLGSVAVRDELMSGVLPFSHVLSRSREAVCWAWIG